MNTTIKSPGRLCITFEEILKMNGGNKEDTQKIIDIYQANGRLSLKNNDQFQGYLSETLTKKDLILNSRFDRSVTLITKLDLAIKPVYQLAGWFTLVFTQFVKFNIIEWFSQF
jgi:hypothetical protein